MEYLFVYGTLLNTLNTEMAVFLKAHSQFVGTGCVYGKLYDIGDYPGVILSDSKSDKVYGHVIKVVDWEKTFKKLDDYEGVGSSFQLPNEYNREVVDVHMESDNLLKCWIYTYNFTVKSTSLIPSGNYINYLLSL